eukprot:jgi/Picsp_1/6720/NSC_04062-R1_---NA---
MKLFYLEKIIQTCSPFAQYQSERKGDNHAFQMTHDASPHLVELDYPAGNSIPLEHCPNLL